jgi:pimeloyl-ACP methyl ester carboxylesterase
MSTVRNSYPVLNTESDNLRLVVHQTNPVEGAIPLLFCHGCELLFQVIWSARANQFQGPGSFIEVKKLLPLLHGRKVSPAFHIVAPSLPNFGFSNGVTKRGFGIAKYAETLNKLMLRLGYNEYGIE